MLRNLNHDLEFDRELVLNVDLSHDLVLEIEGVMSVCSTCELEEQHISNGLSLVHSLGLGLILVLDLEDKGPVFDIALIHHKHMFSCALQSRKWQLISMC